MTPPQSENRPVNPERGWLGEPPQERERTPPSHAYKWYKMMGAAHLLPDFGDEQGHR